MKPSHLGILLVIVGVLALLPNLGINICGVIIGGLFLYFGFRMFYFSKQDMEKVAKHFMIPETDATHAKIEVNHAMGRLGLAKAEIDNAVVNGNFTGGSEPSAEQYGDELRIKLMDWDSSWSEVLVPWKWNPYFWNIGLSPTLPIQLKIGSGLSDMHLDLSELKLTKFKLEFGLGSAKVIMPAAAGFTKAKIDTGLSSLNIRIPEGVAAKIKVDGLGGFEVDRTRFPKNGDVYQSSDYDTATNKLELEIDYGLSSVNIK